MQLRVLVALRQQVATLEAELLSFGSKRRRRHRIVAMSSLRVLALALRTSCGRAESRLW